MMLADCAGSPAGGSRNRSGGRMAVCMLASLAGMLVVGIWGSEARAEEDPSVVRKRLGRILDSKRYQTHFPPTSASRGGEESRTGEEPRTGGSRSFGQGTESEDEAHRRIQREMVQHSSRLEWFSFVLRYVAYVVGVVGVLWILSGLILSWKGRRVLPPAAADLPVEEVSTSNELPASTLAEEGRFAEALHALLLEAIHTLASSLQAPPSSSRTSRELIEELGLEDQQRRSFHRLVLAVEQNRFGGRPVREEQYRTGCSLFRQVIGRDAA